MRKTTEEPEYKTPGLPLVGSPECCCWLAQSPEAGMDTQTQGEQSEVTGACVDAKAPFGLMGIEEERVRIMEGGSGGAKGNKPPFGLIKKY